MINCVSGELTLSVEQQRSIGIPFQLLADGKRRYERCSMYNVDLTSWLRSNNVSQLDSLPTPDPTWPVVKCTHGWNYDKKDYDSTLVTEVRLAHVKCMYTIIYINAPICE